MRVGEVSVVQSLIGSTGAVIVATRGDAGPGEVSLAVRGGTESYLAWSQRPLPRGTQIVVTDSRGPRTVEIESLEDLAAGPDPVPADDRAEPARPPDTGGPPDLLSL